MAVAGTTWGAANQYGFQLGIGVSGKTIYVYGYSSQYVTSSYATMVFSGVWGSGSKSFTFTGPGEVLLHQTTGTGVNGTYGVSTSSTYGHLNASHSRSLTWTTPPGTPGTTSWSRHSNGSGVTLTVPAVSGADTYTWQFVRGAEGWANLGTSSTPSYSRASLSGNTVFRFRCVASNSAGSSAAGGQSTLFYTPGPKPGKPTLSRSADGVGVSWTSTAAYHNGFEVERSTGGTVLVGSGSATVAKSWNDSGAIGVGLQYRVRTFAGPAGSSTRVFSEWSDWSAAISALLPPNPPSLTAPAGTALKGSTLFAWRHNPADGTTQTAAEVRYRLSGATAWTTATTTTAQSLSRTLAAGEWEWQARTKGLDPAWSEWSSVAVFRLITKPVVTVTTPAPGVQHTPKISASWITDQAENLPQSAWKAELADSSGILETQTGAGSTGSFAFAHTAENDSDLWVTITTAVSGVWADPETVAISVEFLPPAAPMIRADWDESSGCHVVTVTPGVGGDEPTAALVLDRSVDGGGSWESVMGDLPPAETTLNDFQGLSSGSTLFRATAVTVLGASASTQTVVVTTSDGVWVGAGVGFAGPTHLRINPENLVSMSRSRAQKRYSGRALPVVFDGRQIGRTLSLSATVEEKGSPVLAPRLDDLAVADSPHLWRDHFGRRIFFSLDGGITVKWLGSWREGPETVARFGVDFSGVEVTHTP